MRNTAAALSIVLALVGCGGDGDVASPNATVSESAPATTPSGQDTAPASAEGWDAEYIRSYLETEGSTSEEVDCVLERLPEGPDTDTVIDVIEAGPEFDSPYTDQIVAAITDCIAAAQ